MEWVCVGEEEGEDGWAVEDMGGGDAGGLG